MWLRVVVRGPVGGYPRILPCSCCLGLPLSVDVWVGRCFGGGGGILGGLLVAWLLEDVYVRVIFYFGLK